uniref:L1 transposable element RRM domain-containing protein n=1 Tax=Latimeria chalumnae TaxID=7897 RepID=H2ZZC0_LATCH
HPSSPGSATSSDSLVAEQGISSAGSTPPWEDKSEGMSRDIKNMYALLQKVAGDIESLKETAQNMGNRLSTAEDRISTAEDQIQQLESGMRDLGKKLEAALTKVNDLENRSHRNNIRIVGFPENVEEGSPMSFLSKKIPELLGLESGMNLDIERAHRTLAPRPAPGQRPRAFMVRFLKFQMKELVLRTVRTKGTIKWNESGIHFFPDLSRELQAKRQRFAGVRQRLRDKGARYRTFYPAVLKITINGVTTTFSAPEEAEAFVNGLDHGDHAMTSAA